MADRVVIIGGGLAKLGEWIMEPIRETLKVRVKTVPLDRLQVIPAALGGEAGVIGFCKAIVEATGDIVCAYKPNLAFFLSRGSAGIDALSAMLKAVPPSVPVILDGKFGDIGNTAKHYAAFAFEYLGADAATVSPYLGTEATGGSAAGCASLFRFTDSFRGEFGEQLVEPVGGLVLDPVPGAGHHREPRLRLKAAQDAGARGGR